MNLKELDLQTLTIFCELHRLGSASKVAKKLGLSNSRVSRRLGVLREMFQDELFVRRNRRQVATGRAKEFLPLCQDMIANFESMQALCMNPASHLSRPRPSTFMNSQQLPWHPIGYVGLAKGSLQSK
ncbi:regulatory helix-turn-helix protein, lysR family [Ferrimonas sediminum]|uniref:Regulatory helix-turn-helix protein, lysR family n=1 Tax=Ferrimonas sediminum TaxID=718193 RepID=A0A1G8WI79_9GAMM|nr:LysR family transcriptional regulator [Ferrimonas sediminum]SDJ77250.1 regulatory helix-turn-helix protein, lysR family [Ferrimonas sediminum]